MRLNILGLALFTAKAVFAAGDSSAESLMEAGHWKRARSLVEQRVDTTPTDPRAISILSRIKWAYGDGTALQLAERAVSLDPSNADYHFYLAEILGEMARGAGTLRGIGLAQRFKNEIAMALALNPRHTFAMFARMLFYWEAPGIVGGDKGKALSTADAIANIEPARGNFARARLASLRNDTAGQETYYLRAVELNPRYYTALVELAALYGAQGQKGYDQAEHYAHAAQEVDQGRVGAYIVLAEINASRQRWTDLDVSLGESAMNVPDDFTPFYRAAAKLIDQNIDLPRAERYLWKYLSQEPEAKEPQQAQAHRLLGLAFEKQENWVEAIEQMEQALRLQPDFPRAKNDLKRLTRSTRK
jgi:tetratricopeptide (TPR) repeat protein